MLVQLLRLGFFLCSASCSRENALDSFARIVLEVIIVGLGITFPPRLTVCLSFCLSVCVCEQHDPSASKGVRRLSVRPTIHNNNYRSSQRGGEADGEGIQLEAEEDERSIAAVWP